MNWREEATCAQTDPNLWFPEQGQNCARVKRICFECPVRTQCLEEALSSTAITGIWGGTTDKERNRIRREQRQDQEIAA